MTCLAAVLDLCIWAGEGFDGLDRWLAMPERLQSLWFEHWNNTRAKAYDPPPVIEKSPLEIERESMEANQKWFEMAQENRRKRLQQ